MLILADLIPGVEQITLIRDPLSALSHAADVTPWVPAGSTPIKPAVDVAMFQVSRPQKLVSFAIEDIDHGVLKKGAQLACSHM